MKGLFEGDARLMRKLADKLLEIEIVQETLEKKAMSLTLGSKPWAQATSGRETCGVEPVFDACSVPILSLVPLHLCL